MSIEYEKLTKKISRPFQQFTDIITVSAIINIEIYKRQFRGDFESAQICLRFKRIT